LQNYSDAHFDSRQPQQLELAPKCAHQHCFAKKITNASIFHSDNAVANFSARAKFRADFSFAVTANRNGQNPILLNRMLFRELTAQ